MKIIQINIKNKNKISNKKKRIKNFKKLINQTNYGLHRKNKYPNLPDKIPSIKKILLMVLTLFGMNFLVIKQSQLVSGGGQENVLKEKLDDARYNLINHLDNHSEGKA